MWRRKGSPQQTYISVMRYAEQLHQFALLAGSPPGTVLTA
jgi:hypothetical protein